MLDGSDEALIHRVRELTEDQIAGTHYNDADMKRRIRDYRDANNNKVAEPAVQDFFLQQGIKFFKESMQTSTRNALNSFKIYIERVSSNHVPVLFQYNSPCFAWFRTRNRTIT